MPDKYNKKASRSGKAAPPEAEAFEVRVLPPEDYYNVSPALAVLLSANVAAGTCFEYTLPFTEAQAAIYWRRQAEAYRSRQQLMICAHRGGPNADEDEVLACVTLVFDREANGKHRAELQKLLVAEEAREGPVTSLILAKAEHMSRQNERWLLYAKVAAGSDHEALFASQSFQRGGVLPFYYQLPDKSGYTSLTQMTKILRQSPVILPQTGQLAAPG